MTRKYTLADEEPEPTEQDRRRFRNQVDTESTPDGCHNWKGSIGNKKDPRGKFQAQGIQDSAYRWAVVFAGRLLKMGDVVNHVCNNSKCVREDHLDVTDHQGNTDHMVISDRHGRAKLTTQEVESIRQVMHAPDRPMVKEVAQKYEVSSSCISKIKNGHSWKALRRR